VNRGKLKLTAQGDREIVMARVFDAPRDLVFDAYTKPELLKRWMGVFGGWTLPVCEIDLRVGGTYRFVWRNADGTNMGMRGVYREVVRPERLVNTEKFDEAWYPGESLIALVLTEKAGKTTMTVTMRYESREARRGHQVPDGRRTRRELRQARRAARLRRDGRRVEERAPMNETTRPRRVGRSIAAAIAGLLAIFVLSLGTDAALRSR